MSRIALNQGLSCIVDEEDWAELNQYSWYVQRGRCGQPYAYRSINKPAPKRGGKRVSLGEFMHRRLLGLSREDNLMGDHINGDTLDNRRSNLRKVTASQSAINRGRFRNSKSGHKGVYWRAQENKWVAQIKVDKQTVSLGRFTNIEDAIAARKRAEKKLHGEFARKD